jgi:hypothetical protein
MTAANPNTPAGLQPYQRRGSASYRANTHMYYIANGDSSAYFVGDPVKRIATPASANGIPTVTIAVGATSALITGAIVGFVGVGTATASSPQGSFFPLSGSPGPMHIPANNTTGYYVMVDDDPNTEYVIQADATQLATSVGKTANLVAGTGGAYTGLSGWQIATSTVGTASTKQVIILDVLAEPDNVVGAGRNYSKFIVRINQSTEGLAATGI